MLPSIVLDNDFDAEGCDRYIVTLPSGQIVLIDTPSEGMPDRGIDIWVLNSIVAIGDTPEDGFATFTRQVNDPGRTDRFCWCGEPARVNEDGRLYCPADAIHDPRSPAQIKRAEGVSSPEMLVNPDGSGYQV